MKICADWLSDPAAQAVFSMLENADYQAFAVGGCVRNSVFGLPVNDVDIATDAPPDQVVLLAKSAGLHPVPTGIDHGTITVISAQTPFEVTTFRRDIETDGRHAIVAFSTDLAEDAKRRDFTMNALYCTRNGTIIDPLNGMDDAKSRHLRFIGDAQKRILEDSLRILRFFRFYAQYCDPNQGIDPAGLAACAANLDGLDGLSKERIGVEMRKLLATNDPAPAMAAMAKSGVLLRILPGANPQFLAALSHLEKAHDIAPNWRRRLAVLGAVQPEKSLRLSKADQKYLSRLGKGLPLAETAYRFGAGIALDDALVLAASLGSPLPDGFQQQITLGANAVFPVAAADLMPEIPPGPNLGKKLAQLEARWIKSDFSLDKAELL